MAWRRFHTGIAGGLLVVAFIVFGVFVAEHYDASSSQQRQTDAVEADIELLADRLTRDLTQSVAVVQGLVALVSGNPSVDQATFASYTRNFRRGREELRRVYLVRDGKVFLTDRPAASDGSFSRLEARLSATASLAAAAMKDGSAVMDGPFTTTENESVFLYARPIFLGDGSPTSGQFWGFAGINIDETAVSCPFGLCDKQPKYRMALRIITEGMAQRPFVGDGAMFSSDSDSVRAFVNIPGVRIEIAAVPAQGWVEGSPRRWMIRGVGVAFALVAGGLVVLLLIGGHGKSIRTRVWAAAGSTGVLLLVLGIAAVLDKMESERASLQMRDKITDALEMIAAHRTRDISDDVAVIQNLSTFIEADPNFNELSFTRYAERIRQLHPRIESIELARDGKISNIYPPAPSRLGLDLRRTSSRAAEIEHSIAAATPIFSGPVRYEHAGEVFLYRQPIFLGEGPPSPDRLWGFATVMIDRDSVVCPLGFCEQPPKFRYGLRLVSGQSPQAPFAGDPALFAPNSNSANLAVRLPGGRIEAAAIPVGGWTASSRLRWVIWIVAIPLALAASGRLLLVFFGLSAPILRVWVGLLAALGGLVLALLHRDLTEMLRTSGVGRETIVTPVIATLIAYSVAYTVNAVLVAFVWPVQEPGRTDSLQRAPSILRHFIAILLYSVAALWVAAFAFDLDLQGVGLTSGAATIIIGFATQRLILDFFSGVMLGIERPFAIGDWLEFDADKVSVVGVVYEMTWRTTLIRDPHYDIVTIPNSVLSQSTIRNRSRPNRWSQVSIIFEIGHDVPSDKIEQAVVKSLEPLIGTVLSKERQFELRAIEIRNVDIRYRLNVYATLGPNSELPVKDAAVRALRIGFAAAGIRFS